MPLTHPPLIKANPGDPITSEGWNNIVQSIKSLYEAHNQTASQLTVELIDSADNQVVKNASVTLLAVERPPLIASYAGAGIQKYLVNAIAKGTYKLYAEAQGYESEKREVVVSDTGKPVNITIEMSKTQQQKAVPNLFGMKLSAAKAALDSAGFLLNRIIDSHGKEITADMLADVGARVKVLNQVPEAGLLHDVGGPVALLVSAKPAAEQRVKVPDLQGMRLNEAREALESVGLTLGETTTVTPKS